MKRLACFFAISMFFLSCKAQTDITYSNDERGIKINFSKGDDSTLTFINDADTTVMISYCNSLFGHDISMINTIRLDEENSVFRYIILKCFNRKGEGFLIGLAVKASPGNNKLFEPSGDGVHHSCAGVQCGCCTFLKNNDGSIKGCGCVITIGCYANGNSYCNHSITTAK